MSYEWTHEDGVWSAPVGDGTISVELYDDEAATFPPLVAVLAEVERLREVVRRCDVEAGDRRGEIVRLRATLAVLHVDVPWCECRDNMGHQCNTAILPGKP